MVVMQPTWRWSTYKLFSTMVVCKILMAFLGWFCLLVLMGYYIYELHTTKMLLSKFKFNLFHSWLMSIVWHTKQPWLPKPFQVYPLHQSMKRWRRFWKQWAWRSWTMSRPTWFLCWTQRVLQEYHPLLLKIPWTIQQIKVFSPIWNHH